MQILTPEAAKKGSTAAENELRARLRDLSSEEERLVLNVNSLRAEEVSEKERITSDMVVFRAGAKAERDRISAEIAEKESDVAKLEERRAEAMKPIDEVSREADERNAESKEREEAIGRREQAAKDADELHARALEDIHDKEQELDEREDGLDAREDMVKSFEEQTAASAKSLGDKWAEYHATVAVTNTEMERREDEMRVGTEANEVARGENAKEAARLRDEDRAVRDKYAALEQAKVHLGIK